MQNSFWQTLPKPILALAPMDGVTDQPYRHIQKKYGRPDVIYTEFTSVEGVCHKAERLLRDFLYDETQRPIVAQIFGTTPDYFRQTAVLLCQLGFDGIDLNMGCPAKNVAQSGAGAALIKTPQLAQEIIKATQAGVQDWINGKTARDCPDISAKIATEVEKRHKKLPEEYQKKRQVPVSVKTRVGFDEKITTGWISILLEVKPTVIALHGRTLRQAYGGEADWEEIGRAVKLAHDFSQKNSQPRTLILGNGDVKSYEQAIEKVEKYGVDGVLIGRASFGNPFVFQPKSPNHLSDPEFSQNSAGMHSIFCTCSIFSQKCRVQKVKNVRRTQSTKILKYQVALEHAQLYEKTYAYDERANFLPMRKHLGWYVRGLDGAKEIRSKLFQTNNSQEVEEIFKKYELLY